MIGWFIGGLNTCVSIPECKLLHKISAIIISYCSRPTGKRSLVPHYSNATGIDCCSGTATFASTNNYNCDWWEWESPNLKHIMLSSIKLNRHLASGLMQELFLAAKTFLTRWVSRTEGFLRLKDCLSISLIHSPHNTLGVCSLIPSHLSCFIMIGFAFLTFLAINSVDASCPTLWGGKTCLDSSQVSGPIWMNWDQAQTLGTYIILIDAGPRWLQGILCYGRPLLCFWN